jgi:hypothetical protein
MKITVTSICPTLTHMKSSRTMRRKLDKLVTALKFGYVNILDISFMPLRIYVYVKSLEE